MSAADDQDYVDDQLAPTETRPGNESGIAAASVAARYHGRPVFDVPPSLAQVPVVLTPEVNGRQLRCRLDLTPFVTAGVLGAGDVVLPERAAADAVFASYQVTNDGRVIALVLDPRPGDIEAEVIVPNPTDRAAVIAALQGNRTDGLEDRFAVFLAGSHPFRDRLFTRVAESPDPVRPVRRPAGLRARPVRVPVPVGGRGRAPLRRRGHGGLRGPGAVDARAGSARPTALAAR